MLHDSNNDKANNYQTSGQASCSDIWYCKEVLISVNTCIILDFSIETWKTLVSFSLNGHFNVTNLICLIGKGLWFVRSICVFAPSGQPPTLFSL